MPSKAFRTKTGSLLGVFFFSSSSLGCHVFAGKVGILAFRRFSILWYRRPNNPWLCPRLDQVTAHICGCLFCHEIFLFVSDRLEVHSLAFFRLKITTIPLRPPVLSCKTCGEDDTTSHPCSRFMSKNQRTKHIRLLRSDGFLTVDIHSSL